MFAKTAEKVTEKIISNGMALDEDKDIYKYGIQQGLILFLNFGSVILLALCFGRLWECVLFMGTYFPLRRFAGGYHARTARRCYFYSMLMVLVFLLNAAYVPYSAVLYGCVLFFAVGVIYWLAPVEDSNKPLDAVEQTVYRKKARSILFFEVLLSSAAMVLQWNKAARSMISGVCMLAVMLLLGTCRNVRLAKPRTRE